MRISLCPYFSRLLMAVPLLLAWSAGLYAQLCPDPNKRLSQFLVKNWTTADGLPSNNLIEIVQHTDGYLWMTSYNGLVQFDGVSFATYGKVQIPQLSNNASLSLLKSPDSTLWVGTQGSGLLAYKNGRFAHYPSDLLMKNLLLDGQTIWIGTQDRGVVKFSLKDKTFTTVEHPSLNEITINSIVKDQNGKIWMATEGRGIVAYHEGQFIVYQESVEHVQLNISHDFCMDRKGRLWIGSNNGLFFLEKGELHYEAQMKGYTVRKFVLDEAGNMWMATGGGLFRMGEKFGLEQLSLEGDDSNFDVQDISIDREGSLWFTTYRNGLFHVRDGKFTNFTHRDGLASKSIGSLCQFGPNQYLVGSINGKLNVIDNGKVWELKTRFELPKDRVYHVLRDSQKNLWICTYQGLFLISSKGGKELHYDETNGLHGKLIRHIFEDSKGRLWVGTRSNGLGIWNRDDEKLEMQITTEQGLGSNFILSIKELKNGNMAIGTVNGGLSILSPDGKVLQVYKPEQGMISDLVFSTHEDAEGVLWLATNTGLSRFANGKFTNYNARQNLPSDAVFDVLEDKKGMLWFPSNNGIISIAKGELNKYAADTTHVLAWRLYDKGDGMYSEQCAGATHSIKSNDGMLLIPTFGGVVMIDPDKVTSNKLPPPVHVNSLWVDNKVYDAYQSEEIVILPGSHRFSFFFSGLSLLAPDRVKFRYQITGYDEGWQEDTYERRAIYTNLPPGEHEFRVIAANNDGVWNEEGASIKFVVQPYFTQTPLFYGLLTLVLGLATAIFVNWRSRRVKQRTRELEEQVTLRTQELSKRNDEVLEKSLQLGNALNKVTDSVRYAKRIQQAILGPIENITSQFKDSFILLQPRDIVSGDFYWYAKKFGKKIIVASDCTGHGVPGAFMTVMGIDMLNEAVNHHGITETDQILRELDRSLSQTLHAQEKMLIQESEEEDSSRSNAVAVNDGMDIAVLCINEEDHEFEFSGAKNPLYLVREGKVTEVKGSPYPIGGRQFKEPKRFESQTFKMKRGDIFYIFSDGYQDQFGGKTNRKFMKKRFREMLESICHLPMEEQKAYLQDTIERWKGDTRQTDDILVIGIKV